MKALTRPGRRYKGLEEYAYLTILIEANLWRIREHETALSSVVEPVLHDLLRRWAESLVFRSRRLLATPAFEVCAVGQPVAEITSGRKPWLRDPLSGKWFLLDIVNGLEVSVEQYRVRLKLVGNMVIVASCSRL